MGYIDCPWVISRMRLLDIAPQITVFRKQSVHKLYARTNAISSYKIYTTIQSANTRQTVLQTVHVFRWAKHYLQQFWADSVL